MRTAGNPTTDQTDPHIAWWETAAELAADMTGKPDLANAEMNWAGERMRALHGLIADTPATSLAAVACQVRVGLATLREETDPDHGLVALERALVALERLGTPMERDR